ncbi:hypothetical protein ABOM_007872 [Aspergillus bombycis]|uniref:NAD-binding Rossmann fold oxidoreductase family protein n=1 Tax=Aspergillus bombycis TaxID=109264 RepID=A0A1F7ZTC9_9EURO|nr:hypothetical protein ABOM_007872 [Aspergillus bombycis]OGM42338.1 hypothetical protein ABOM_007872 [Aspergillus bombycis]
MTPQAGQSDARPRQVGVGVIGIGRMGRQHALNLLRTPSAKLICACSPAQADMDWAGKSLAPYGVSIWSSFEDMLNAPGLEAVVIASATPFHQPQTLECIRRGIHVLCEKPVAENTSQVEELLTVARAHPTVKVMVGFMRRFDENYLDAFSRIGRGEIGEPLVIRSQAYDTLDTSPQYKEYLKASGGIFLDATIHDIDLVLSFFGRDVRPKAVWAAGLRSYHKELSTTMDADNAVGICEFHDSKIAFFYNSRTSPRGFDNQTEIVGTSGKISVNLLCRQNKVESATKMGSESNRLTAEDALKSLQIAEALQHSLVTGEKVEFSNLKPRI